MSEGIWAHGETVHAYDESYDETQRLDEQQTAEDYNRFEEAQIAADRDAEYDDAADEDFDDLLDEDEELSAAWPFAQEGEGW